MSDIEVFVQAEQVPDIVLVRVPADGTVRHVVEALQEERPGAVADDGRLTVWLEDADEPLPLDAQLQSAGVVHRGRLHVHRCQRIVTTVNFQQDTKTRIFPPSATLASVFRWAVGDVGFDLNDRDATDYLLQVCGSSTRPDEDTHLGALTQSPQCQVCFDLVMKVRVEG